jgi:hypothetical protein
MVWGGVKWKNGRKLVNEAWGERGERGERINFEWRE